ncbi:MAG TPA: hypothetical protein DHV36_08870 [Desulfobacteraceae bacterium]|nr:hypothetical protein [Desulfobacteraceae bacterium]
MPQICQNCHEKFLNLYDGICHQCWSKKKSYSEDQNEKFTEYICPSCDKLLFKGKVSKLTMTCPRCNKFVKLP